MSNINRAVTRTRRAAPARRGQASLAQLRKTLALAQLREQMYPPFTVARRAAPAGGDGQATPMTAERRLANYTRQNNGGRLTSRQSRRALHEQRAQENREAVPAS